MKLPQGPESDARPLIVVVDDDEDTRLNLSDILEMDGYQVATAGTASELFSRRSWDDVSVVLLDRKLPDGTPQKVVPLLRQKAPDAAVIMVTGNADIEGAIAAVRNGVADYILKPVSPDSLRASVRRVVERQRAEREIARLQRVIANSEARYRSLFENALDGLLILDDQKEVIAVNPAACVGLGRPSVELVGTKLKSLQLRASAQLCAANWSDSFGSPQDIGQCTFVRPNGVEVQMEFRAIESFAPGLHLLSLRDITAHKQAEERAVQAERLAAIGETMAALVHESRNALQRSKACLEMLTLELENQPEALKLVAGAQRAQDDLHRLYEEVRQWAAPLNLRKQACNLRDLWREVWNDVGVVRPGSNTQLVEEVFCDPTCQVDRFSIAQVFRNIFENAIDASPPGSTVTVRCANADGQGSNEIVIEIVDQGPGLSAEQQAYIFKPFFTTKAKGTGLGMAIAFRIVQSHGGTITARSLRGAKIEISLPRGGK